MRLFGFCLEWLRNKVNSSNQPAGLEIARKVSQRYQCLLPPVSGTLLNRQQLKVIQSYLSLNGQIPNLIKYDIQHHLYTIIEKFLYAEQLASRSEDQQELGLLLQQVFSVLMLCLPENN